jgi:hypothetical protein
MNKIKISKKTTLTIPGAPLSSEEFKSMIQEAEKGPFYSMQHTTQLIDKWKTKYAK